MWGLSILCIGLLAILITTDAIPCHCSTVFPIIPCDCEGSKGKFKIRFYEDENKIHFDCSEGGRGFEIEDLSGIVNISYTIRFVVIEYCDFPQEAIVNVIKRFGESDLTNLKLLNVQKLTKENVVGLINLQYLRLENINLMETNILKLFSIATVLTQNNTIIASTGRAALKHLQIENCNLTNLSAGLFREFRSVQILEIRNNPLTEINKDTFEGLVSVEKLYLYDNKNLNFISDGSLSCMPRLKEIFLEENHLQKLPSRVFTGLNDLSHVSLNNNFLTELPSNLPEGLSELKIFTVKHNSLREIPLDLFKDQVNIQSLDFSLNSIKNIPPEVFINLKTLKELNLNHNQLHELAERVSGPALRPRSEPRSPFYNLSSLQVLRLNNNNISKIYKDWRTELLHLEELDLSNNKFTALTETDLDFNGRKIEINFQYNDIASIKLLKVDSRIPKLKLENNNFNCDCEMHMFSRYLRQNDNQSKLTCTSPENLRQKLIYAISPEEFRCQSKCHPSCVCVDTPGASTKMELECEDIPSLGDLNDYLIKTNSTLRFKHKPSSLVDLPSNITKLYLSNLGIRTLPSLPESISFRALDLSNNRLSNVPVELLIPKGPKLWLSGNEFVCDCDHMEEIELLNRFKYNVEDYASVICVNTKDRVEKATELCRERDDRILAIVLGVLGVICIVMVIVLSFCRQQLVVLSLGKCSCLGQEESLDRDKTYDAFISYAHHDIEFVAGTLVPELETGPEPYKLCLHYRDWNAGDWIPEQILRSVQDSRRTIVVLSEKSLGSDWVLQEFRMAHENANRDRVARVIVVLLEDVTKDERLNRELQAYLTSSTYLMWGDEWFWKKIRDALPQRRRRRAPWTERSLYFLKC